MSGLTTENLPIAKTIKLFIAGEFPRTESGRSYPIKYAGTENIYAHLCQASRKDYRNAVTAAQTAQAGWAGKTAYNRSQILYRMAEMMEGKRPEFLEILTRAFALNIKDASQQIDGAIDALVYYAGFADKYQQLMGSVNPVSGPHHNFTSAEAVGLVTLICDDKLDLTKITADIAAIISSGNSVVAILPDQSGVLLAALAEVFATSDLPKGVINLLSGSVDELKNFIGSHMEVDAISYQGRNTEIMSELRTLGVENMKRITGRQLHTENLENILNYVEYKTVWHPIGR
jgi:acyl-CoA reductase-like NAD-dependent aldehyde dehydrogenase